MKRAAVGNSTSLCGRHRLLVAELKHREILGASDFTVWDTMQSPSEIRSSRRDDDKKSDFYRDCAGIRVYSHWNHPSKKLYRVQLKYNENIEGCSKGAAKSRCKKFIEDALKRKSKGVHFCMARDGLYKFCCFLSLSQLKTLEGNSQVESIEEVQHPILEEEPEVW